MSSREAFDATAPEGEAGGRNAYISKRDLKILGLVLLVLAAFLYPVYRYLQKESHKSRCKNNLGAISKALGMYRTEHDDRFPPAYRAAEDGLPMVNASRLAYTWIDDLHQYMPPRVSFTCPAAQPSELAYVEHPTRAGMRLGTSYGLYTPYSSFLHSIIENPDQQLVVAETTNGGARGSFDPLPLKSSDGLDMPYDGFVIGWDNGNAQPNAKTRAVTRLAFYGVSDGKFEEHGEGRHDGGCFALSAAGGLIHLPPTAAQVQIVDDLPAGQWAVPVTKARIPSN